MSTTPSHIARYSVVEPIASGGMGEVFLARDEQLDRLVAIKLLRDGFDDDELRARFEEEARNVAKLTHPNIVTIYEYGAHGGRPYIAMEYVAGYSLADLIRRKVPLPLARRVRLIEELCSGLGHAHRAHLVHRDIKPANLMVASTGILKVLDFGIAKLRGSDRTQKGMLVGTVNYMSPEQITGGAVDHRSDIFAVGLVLYEVLTYDRAFKGDLTSAMFSIVHGEPEALAVKCPGLDDGFQAVVNRCLAKKPEDRYQDLSLLKRELAALRRALEDDDADLADTLVPLDATELALSRPVPTPTPSAPSAEDAAAREAALAAEVGALAGRARAALAADALDDARQALAEATVLAPEADDLRGLAATIEQRAAELARVGAVTNQARESLAGGDLDRARELVATALTLRPGDGDALGLRDEIAHAEAARRAAAEAEAEAARRAAEARADAERQAEAARQAAAAAEAEAARRAAAEAEARAAREQADAARRAEEAREAAEAERARSLAGFLDAGRRANAPLADRRRALADLLALAPGHSEGGRLLAEVDAAIDAERERSKIARAALDETVFAPEPRSTAAATPPAAARGDETALATRPWYDQPITKHASKSGVRPVPRPPDQPPTPGSGQAPVPAARSKAPRLAVAALGTAAVVALGLWLRPAGPDDVPVTPDAPAESSGPSAGAVDENVPATPSQAEATPGAGSDAPAAETASPATTPEADATAQNGARAETSAPPGAPASPTPRMPPPLSQSGNGAPPVSAPSSPSTQTAAGTASRVPFGTPPPPPVPQTHPDDTAATRVQTSIPNRGAAAGSTPSSPARPTASGNRADTTAARNEPSTRTAANPQAPPPSAQRPSTTVAQNTPPRTAPSTQAPITSGPVERLPAPPPAVDSRQPEPPGGASTAAPGTGSPAPSRGPAEPAAPSDETQIRGVLQAFTASFQSKDVGQLRRYWPTMGGNVASTYSRMFASYSSVAWTLRNAAVNVTGQTAVANCAVQVDLRDLRSGKPTSEQRAYRVTLARRGAVWVITNMEFGGGGR